MTNLKVSQQFDRLAIALSLIDQKKYFFQIRSYQKIAQVLRDLPVQIKEIWKQKKTLDDIEGVGPAIEGKIIELLETGHSTEIDQYISQIPEAVFTLVQLPGIGGKKALKLVTTFSISADNPIEQLKRAATQGRIRELDGFGEKSEQDILKWIDISNHQQENISYQLANSLAVHFMRPIKSLPEVNECLPLGSLRRMKAIVRDIDIGVSTDDFTAVKKVVKNMKTVSSILADGENLIRVILSEGIQVDCKYSPPEKWGAFLQHFTGSKEHNIKLREFALKQNKSLSEHGIRNTIDKTLRTFHTEEAFYHDLGLKWIPPENRVGADEILESKLFS